MSARPDEESPNEPAAAASPSTPTPVVDGLTFSPSNEVLFKGPFNRPSKTTITVVNQSAQAYVFKVLVTQPRRYLIRPNYGLVEAGSSLEVKAEMRPLPPGGEALDALLATRQKLLFKWRPVVASASSSSSSPASKKSSSGENPSALFITSTTPISETGIYIRFEPQITPTPTESTGSAAAKQESVPAGSAEATPGGGGGSPTGVGAPATALDEDQSGGGGGGAGSGLMSALSSRPGLIISTSALVLLLSILICLAYMAYLHRNGSSGSSPDSQRFLRRYIF